MSDEGTVEVRDTMSYTPKQREFMYHAVEDDDCTDLYFCGGVRSGKSVSMVKAGWHTAMRYPGSHGLLTRNTLKELKSATLDSTVFGKDADGKEIIPKDTIADHSKDMQQIIFKNGSKWSYFGMDQIERFLGMEFSYWMAEEANRYKRNVLEYVRNTRICHTIGPHKVLMNSNTDTGQDYLYDRFFEEDNPGHKAVVVTTLDNMEHLPEKFLEELKRLKKRDPTAYNVYVMAQFQGLAGLVYPQFNPMRNIVDPFDIPREWKRILVFDHGFSHYAICGDFRVDHEGNVWMVDEWAEQNLIIPQISRKLIEKGWNKIDFADPSIAKQKTQSSVGKKHVVTLREDYEDNGIEFRAMADNSNAGIARVRAYLWSDPNRIHPILQEKGAPRLYFFRGKTSLTSKQIANWRLKASSDGLATEEAVDGDDDGCDIVKYCINSNPTAGLKGMPEPDRNPWDVPPWERTAQESEGGDIFAPGIG